MQLNLRMLPINQGTALVQPPAAMIEGCRTGSRGSRPCTMVFSRTQLRRRYLLDVRERLSLSCSL
jgi:hypothetical protein